MFTKIEITEELNAITYDNKRDIRIQIAYPKYDRIREQEAINKFWREFERLSINSRIVNGL